MYEFNEQTRALTDLVRKLVNQYQMPLETRLLRGETITKEDYVPGTQAAREAGLWGLNLPVELGGVELSTVDKLAITEENYRCVTPLKFGGSTLPSLYSATAEQKERYLYPLLEGKMHMGLGQTEPSGGGDPARAISTHAVRDGGEWVINGTKIWLTGIADADVIFVVCRTDKEKLASGISVIAVEKSNPGVHCRPIPMLGGFNTHQVTFSDCRVPLDCLIGNEGNGFRDTQIALSGARFDVAARALGIAQRAYEMMVDYSKQRVVFGGPLSEKQAIQGMIVDSWIEIQKNRLMLYRSAEMQDAGQDARVQASMMKMLCTEMAQKVIDRAIQVHGAAGCTYESPLAHWYDHQRMARIYEGPTEVHKYRVMARYLLG